MAGITAPALVTAARLELVEGVGSKRALRLAAAFEDARPCYEVAELLMTCRVPARYAGPAVARLGASAARQLREDPWRLLSLPQLRPDQADWFARQVLGDAADPQDRRRGRALVAHLLTRGARDGHTAVPAEAVARSLGRFRISDPAAAIEAAVDEGAVLPFSASGPDTGADPDAGAGPDTGPAYPYRRGRGGWHRSSRGDRRAAGTHPLRPGGGGGRRGLAAAGGSGRAAPSRSAGGTGGSCSGQWGTRSQ